MVREDVADPLVVSAADARRAAVWMHEHRIRGIEPTPLLAARLRARRRIGWAMFGVAAVLVGLAATLMTALTGLSAGLADRARLTIWISVISLVALIKWLRHRALLLADRRIGAALTRRAAHSIVPGWRSALGLPGLAVLAVTYGGSLLLAAVAAVLVDTVQDRLILALLLPGYAFMAAMTAVEVSYTLGRPALADDPVSLAVDDALRIEDVRGTASDALPLITTLVTVSALEPAVVGRIYGLLYPLIVLILGAQLYAWNSARTHRAAGLQPPVAS